jgi:hypothetical protein
LAVAKPATLDSIDLYSSVWRKGKEEGIWWRKHVVKRYYTGISEGIKLISSRAKPPSLEVPSQYQLNRR